MARDPVIELARRKRGGHTHTRETVTKDLPPEAMAMLEQALVALNDLARRVGILESCIKSAGETLDEIDRRRRAAG